MADLTGLAPKGRFIAAEAVERDIGQIGETQKVGYAPCRIWFCGFARSVKGGTESPASSTGESLQQN
jgi:hypothetical protein